MSESFKIDMSAKCLEFDFSVEKLTEIRCYLSFHKCRFYFLNPNNN